MNAKSAGVRETMESDGADGEWEQAGLTNGHRWHQPGRSCHGGTEVQHRPFHPFFKRSPMSRFICNSSGN